MEGGLKIGAKENYKKISILFEEKLNKHRQHSNIFCANGK
jgi:hypothetical protein